MQTYQVVRIDPKIQVITTPKKIFDEDGKVIETREVKKEFQFGWATDGTQFEGKRVEIQFAVPFNSVDVGDLISAWDKNGQLHDIHIVRGRNAVQAPAPATPPPPMKPLPELQIAYVEPWRAASECGNPLSGADLAALASAFLEMERKHKNLADAFRKHLADHAEKDLLR